MATPTFDENERATTSFNSIILSYTGDLTTESFESITTRYMSEIAKRNFTKSARRKSIRLIIQALENIRYYAEKSHGTTPFHLSIYDDVREIEIRVTHFLTPKNSKYISTFFEETNIADKATLNQQYMEAIKNSKEEKLGLLNLARLAPRLEVLDILGDPERSILELKMVIRDSPSISY